MSSRKVHCLENMLPELQGLVLCSLRTTNCLSAICHASPAMHRAYITMKEVVWIQVCSNPTTLHG